MTQKTTKTAVPDAEKESPGIGSILLRMILLMAVIRFFAAFPTPDKLILLIVLILGPGRSSLKFFLTFSVGCAFLFIKWLKETLEELRETAALAADKVSHDAEVAANFLKTDSQNLKKSSPQTSSKAPPTPMQFIPESLQKKSLSDEDARQLAEKWWSSADENGETGEMRLTDLIANICSEDPSIHTALISGEKELRLPTEALAISYLIEIFRKNGIAADLTPDDELVISWGQSEDGAEVSM